MVACAPALDWRDVRVAGGAVTVLFPCKPKTQERALEMGGRQWTALLQVCEAGPSTYSALTLAPREGAPAETSAAALLPELVQTAAQRWGAAQGAASAPEGVRLPASVASAVWARHTRAGAESEVQTQALFLSVGSNLVQLSMHGSRLDATAVETFFGQLRTTP